jgi:SSS family solute:Na+ symporter
LFWKSSTKIASFAGLIVGEFIVFYLILNKLDPLAMWGLHLNAGFVALVVNMAVFVIVSLATRTPAGIERKARAIDGMSSSPAAPTTVGTH